MDIVYAMYMEAREKDLKKFGKLIPKRVYSGVIKSAKILAEHVEILAKWNASRFKASGRLQESIHVVPYGKDMFAMFVDEPYGYYMEYGFRPHWIKLDWIRNWLKIRKINLKQKWRYFPPHIARKINVKAITPQMKMLSFGESKTRVISDFSYDRMKRKWGRDLIQYIKVRKIRRRGKPRYAYSFAPRVMYKSRAEGFDKFFYVGKPKDDKFKPIKYKGRGYRPFLRPAFHEILRRSVYIIDRITKHELEEL